MGFVGSAISWAAKNLLVPLVVGAAKKIVEWIAGDDVGSQPSYNPETATMQETINYKKILSELQNQALDIVAEMEESILAEGKKEIDGLIASLKKGNNRNRNIDSFKRKCYGTLKEFKGASAKIISSRLSLTDSEFLDIASQEAGDKKTRMMEKFCQNVAKESFREAASSFVRKMINIKNDMDDLLIAEFNKEETLMKNAIATLETIKKASNAEQKQEQQMRIALSLSKKMAMLERLKHLE